LLLAESLWGQQPGEPVTGVDKNVVVDCKLPPQTRKLNSSTTTMIPGGVEQLSRDECESRGGSYGESAAPDEPPTQDKAAPAGTPEPSKASVMDAQKQLKDLGFDVGAPDGVMGAELLWRSAVSDRTTPSTTGKLDNATMLQLKKETRPVEKSHGSVALRAGPTSRRAVDLRIICTGGNFSFVKTDTARG
jgi:hypothetical protein